MLESKKKGKVQVDEDKARYGLLSIRRRYMLLEAHHQILDGNATHAVCVCVCVLVDAVLRFSLQGGSLNAASLACEAQPGFEDGSFARIKVSDGMRWSC